MTVDLAGPPGTTVADFDSLMAALASLHDDGLADALADSAIELRAAAARHAAVVSAVVARVEGKGFRISGAAQTIAAITISSTRSATYLMDSSQTVCSRPAVWTALATGSIDLARARIVAEAFLEVDDPDRDALEAQALAYAAGHTPFQTRRYVTRLLIDYNPGLAAQDQDRKRQAAWDKRHIGMHPREHGMADLFGYLPSGTARILVEALDQVARTYPDERTLDQKRVDALAQILDENTVLDIAVDVVIPADLLAGLQESGASVGGFGAVDADDARFLALQDDARWQRLVTEPVTGKLTDLSATDYRIPDALKRGVRARDRYCRFPGCTTRAKHTDTDHVTPWPVGPTTAENLAASCRTHHRMKTHSGWTCEMDPDGTMIWTSPLGTVHRTEPWDYTNPED